MGFFKRLPPLAAVVENQPQNGSGPVEDRSLNRETIPPVFLGGAYPYGEGVGDQQLVSPSAALRIGCVFACVRLLADTAASLSLIAYRDTPQGRVRSTGRLADLLANPAPGITQADLVGTLVAHAALWGDAYVGKYRDDSGVVVNIAPIHPAMITVALKQGIPQYTLVRIDGVSQHGPEDIIHIKALSVDGLLGLSPIQMCKQSLSLQYSLARHADQFARNAGRVGGVLRIPGWRTAQPGAAEEVRGDWEARFAGAAQSGKLLLLAGEDDVTYTQLSLSMVDAQFVEQVGLSLQEICRIFRVPPHLVGVPPGERLTYTSAEMEAQEFLKFSLAPWLVRIEQALSADTDLSPATNHCEFLVDELLRADAATRAAFYTAALGGPNGPGWMTRDEVRALENLPAEAPVAPAAPPEPLTDPQGATPVD